MFSAIGQFVIDFGLYFASPVFVTYLAVTLVFQVIERANMERWYLVYRYYINANGVLAMEPVDGVLCGCVGRAWAIAAERNFLTDKDKLRVIRATLPRELELAKRLDRSHRIAELWSLKEFVEFMQMPAYEKAS
jgi:hypothetical protein